MAVDSAAAIAVAAAIAGPPYTTVVGCALVGFLVAILSRPRPPSTPPARAVAGQTSARSPRVTVPTTAASALDHSRPPAQQAPGSPVGQSDPGARQVQESTGAPDRYGGPSASGTLAGILGALAEDVARTGSRCRPRVVQHSHQHIDLYLDTPTHNAPPGWTVDGDGSIWSRDIACLDRRPTTSPVAAPLLVPIGQPDRDGQLYVDLETAGVTALTGDLDSARRLANQILWRVHRASSSAAIRTVVVGDLIGPLTAQVGDGSVVETWEDIQTDVAAWAAQSHHALAVGSWANPFIARGADPFHHAHAPMLVVASHPPPDALIRALAQNRPAAVAIVTVGTVGADDSVIHCEADTLHLLDLGLTCTTGHPAHDADPSPGPGQAARPPRDPSEISTPHDYEKSGATPGRVSDAPADQAAVPTRSHPGTRRDTTGPSLEGGSEILVRLLGDIRVDGGRPLRTKPTAVLAYIALHRDVSVEALEAACWTDGHGDALRKRLKDVMSECRAAVGSQHLPAATDGRYTVGPAVTTDTQLFDLHLDRATGEPLAQQAHTYRAALELVTGRVFTYPGRAVSSFGWIDTENLLSQWEVKIERTALQCIQAYTDLGDPDHAAEVAVRALIALPLNTTLTEALMHAYSQTGDLGALDTVYRAHADGLARLHDTAPDDTTSTLYTELIHTRRH